MPIKAWTNREGEDSVIATGYLGSGPWGRIINMSNRISEQTQVWTTPCATRQ